MSGKTCGAKHPTGLVGEFVCTLDKGHVDRPGERNHEAWWTRPDGHDECLEEWEPGEDER